MCSTGEYHWTDQQYSENRIVKAIGKAQKDAWNAAVRWSADNAKVTNESTEHITGYLTSEFVVDKQSILNGLIE